MEDLLKTILLQQAVYCKQNDIPLPDNAKKILETSSESEIRESEQAIKQAKEIIEQIKNEN